MNRFTEAAVVRPLRAVWCAPAGVVWAARVVGLVGVAQMLLALSLLATGSARAEPYLAVRSGAKCIACHVNPAGGGKRNVFGSIYGQTVLAAGRFDTATGRVVSAAAAGADGAIWTGQIGEQFGIGADLRATAQSVKVPASEQTPAFSPTRAQVYFEVRPMGDRLSLVLDQRVAPGAATNREAYGLVWFAERRAYLKAGRLYTPFGLRIEDDSAFIRQVTGVNFSASDDGVEGGLEVGPWSASLALSNGAGGGAETNRGKLVSALASYVASGWRVGLSASHNDNDATSRSMASLFGGLRTGRVAWLASAVAITDEGTPLGRLKQQVSLLEANVEVMPSHNLKLSYEHHDPNTEVRHDHRVRYSVVWEATPLRYTQLRLGVRKSDGIPQNNAQNAREAFLQWHAFF